MKETFDRYCHNWFDDESEMMIAWIAWQEAWKSAAKKEREKCAKTCEEVAQRAPFVLQKITANRCADAIRKGE